MFCHKTNSPNIIGYIDNKYYENGNITVSGWCLDNVMLTPCILRIVYTSTNTMTNNNIIIMNRPDVAIAYNKKILNNELLCGWRFTSNSIPCELQAKNGDNWETVFKYINYNIIGNSVPSFVVVDNIYNDPDSVRKFALSCEFNNHINYHKGKRTDQAYRFTGLKERIEGILGKEIDNWDNKYEAINGCFQYCIGGDQEVYHHDEQQYAGIIYLTPNAPVQSGTCFYRSNHTKKMKVLTQEYDTVFSKGHLDNTEFEMVDRVGNVYNRMVIFDAKLIHSATNYFGNKKDNGRLFQLFFFDIL